MLLLRPGWLEISCELGSKSIWKFWNFQLINFIKLSVKKSNLISVKFTNSHFSSCLRPLSTGKFSYVQRCRQKGKKPTSHNNFMKPIRSKKLAISKFCCYIQQQMNLPRISSMDGLFCWNIFIIWKKCFITVPV